MNKYILLTLLLISCIRAETPQAFTNRVLALDGYSAQHLATGMLIGVAMNDHFAEWLYFRGHKKEPFFTDSQKFWTAQGFNFVWEVLIEYGIDAEWSYEKWCNTYGGEFNAWRNNVVDCVLVTAGCMATSKLYFLRGIYFWTNNGNVGIACQLDL